MSESLDTPNYRVQQLDTSGWKDVEDADFADEFHAVRKGQALWEGLQQQTRVLKRGEIVVWKSAVPDKRPLFDQHG